MNADRLATFGRRAFLAGAVLFAVLSTLARVFDWPALLVGVAGFAGGWVAYRLIDWFADRSPIAFSVLDAGRCGQSLDSWSRASPLICALPAGHAGWHRDDNRAEWGPINNPKEKSE